MSSLFHEYDNVLGLAVANYFASILKHNADGNIQVGSQIEEIIRTMSFLSDLQRILSDGDYSTKEYIVQIYMNLILFGENFIWFD